MATDLASTPPPCVVLTLPDELLIPAARTAVEIYPANALPAYALAVLPPQEVAVLTGNYWGSKPRTLSVEFLDSPTQAFRRMFLEAANSWDCGITFAETVGHGEVEQGMVRLSREGRSYSSYLGTDILHIPAGRPTMWLGQFTEHTSNSEWLRVPPHEVGHTLGFPHEHLRREFVARVDRAKAYAYFLRWQGWGKSLVDVNVLTPIEEAALLRPTPPDRVSIMTYPLPAEIMTDNVALPGGDRLDAADLAYADDIYPKSVPPTPPVSPDVPIPEQVHAEINRARNASGLGILATDPRLDALAGNWAATMARMGLFDHGDSGSRIAAVFPGRANGEIIAAGQQVASQAIAGWLESPGHRAILMGDFAFVGCGHAIGSSGTQYWVADFVGAGSTPPPSPPPPPPPPPVKPPEPPAPPPTEEFGPFPLKVGVESDRFTMIPDASVLFRFKATRPRARYVAATRGKTPLRLELLDAEKMLLEFDDESSGIGPNALVAAVLAKGAYYLRVRGLTPEDRGNYRVKVSVVS